MTDQPVAPEGTALSFDIDDVDQLPAARMILRRNLPALAVDAASLFFGAVTEILVNALNAHAAAGVSEAVVVHLRIEEPATITVVDRGEGFDPSLPVHDPTDDSLGKGLAIARAAIPDLRIESTPAGTTVVLPFPAGDRQ